MKLSQFVFHKLCKILFASKDWIGKVFRAHSVVLEVAKEHFPSILNVFLNEVSTWPHGQILFYKFLLLEPIYTILISLHTGLGMAIKYKNLFCLHDTIFISYRINILLTRENSMKRIELVHSRVNSRPIR